MNPPNIPKDKKSILVIIAGLLLVIIPFILFISSLFRSQIPSNSTISAPSPIISGLTIVSTNPTNNSTTANYYQPIQITFSRALSDSERSQIQIELSPSINTLTQWNTNETVTFSPTTALEPNQKYTAAISFEEKTITISFTTLSTQQVGQEQNQADINFTNKMSQTLSKYPWYSSLPLQSDNYFVFFDAGKKQMIGRIYAQSNNLSSDEVSTMETQINSQLTNLGVDLNQYPVSWQTNL